MGRRGDGARRRVALAPALFVAPAVLLLVIFRVLPIIEAFYLSLTRWNGFTDPVFIGFANFVDLVGDPAFKTALVNNGVILLTLPLWIILPFLVAAVLYTQIPGWRFFRTAFFMPAIISPVIIGIFFEVMLRFDGPLNIILREVGLGWLARQWLVDLSTALPLLIAVVVWATFGIGVLIFLAALQGIDPQLLDAARVDGASWLQTQRYVVIPDIQPVVEFWTIVMLILSFTGIFPFVFTLTGGGPGHATSVIELRIYLAAFQSGSLGYASAIGVVLLGIVLVVVALALTWLRRERARFA